VAILIVAVVLLPLLGMTWLIAPRAEVQAQAANDVLVNPGFEEGFYQYQGIGELKIPNGWTPWWHEGDKAPSGTVYRRPEWSPIDVPLAAYLVHSGNASSKMFTTYGAHNAGIYQHVKAIPGQWYTFSAWVYVWSSSGVDGHKSESPRGRYRARVCANPWGSSQQWDDTTICGKEIVDVYDSWQQVSVTFQAWGGEITGFTEGNPWWAVRSNDSTWDDVRLDLATIGQVCPTPQPPVCPVYPTPVVCPVATPCPVCPAPVPGGTCPSLDEIRGVIHQECRFTVNWP
jgi:hypothetical protein